MFTCTLLYAFDWNWDGLLSWWLSLARRAVALLQKKLAQPGDQQTFAFLGVPNDALWRSERTCRFYLRLKDVEVLLGRAYVPPGQDMDSVFPVFHGCNFWSWHREELIDVIYGGAVLTAESDYDDSVEDLAYCLAGGPFWSGTPCTCAYFGCEVPI